jgi:hypothetical protein
MAGLMDLAARTRGDFLLALVCGDLCFFGTGIRVGAEILWPRPRLQLS